MNDQDQRVRDYYAKMSLPQERLQHLLNTEQVEKKKSYFQGVFAVAACVAVLALTVWVGSSSLSHEPTQRAVREVAMNHTTRLEPEFQGETLAKLDNSMQQLPFSLTLPDSIDAEYELVGSRYCSLAGELAAHVKLKHAQTGKAMSLFVTSNGDALKDVRTQQTTLEGIDVELWREGGLFFALAQRS